MHLIQNLISVGNTGILALGSPDKLSPDNSRRNSETGLTDKKMQLGSSSSEEDLRERSGFENGDERCPIPSSPLTHFGLNQEGLQKFRTQESQLDVNAQWRSVSGDDLTKKHRSYSIMNVESQDQAKMVLVDINSRFENSGSRRRTESLNADNDYPVSIPNSAVAANPKRASIRKKLTNPLNKTGSIAQDTAEFFSNTGSKVKNRVSSLTRKNTFLRRLILSKWTFQPICQYQGPDVYVTFYPKPKYSLFQTPQCDIKLNYKLPFNSPRTTYHLLLQACL